MYLKLKYFATKTIFTLRKKKKKPPLCPAVRICVHLLGWEELLACGLYFIILVIKLWWLTRPGISSQAGVFIFWITEYVRFVSEGGHTGRDNMVYIELSSLCYRLTYCHSLHWGMPSSIGEIVKHAFYNLYVFSYLHLKLYTKSALSVHMSFFIWVDLFS